jgi:hypothetical protein
MKYIRNNSKEQKYARITELKVTNSIWRNILVEY